jgi:hypothetical protein
MADRISVGTMFLEDGTCTPESFVVGTERYSAGWSSILKSVSAHLGKELESVGWTFFYMAGEIRGNGFGFNDQSRIDRATAHVIDVVKRQNCNCLEITQISQRSFLGLSYTSVVAHARHIQRSRYFNAPSGRLASTWSGSRVPQYDQPAGVGSKSLLTGEAVQTWENEGGSRAASNRPA